MENDFRLDVDELAALITPRTKLLVINSPANPTGGVLTRSDIERIAELAIRHDLVVLSDEIYARILYDGAEHVSIASLEGMAERTIVLDGFSKTYAMTGWRMGYAIVPDWLVKPFGQLIINTISGVTAFAQAGAIEALRGPQADVDAMVVEFKARRDLIVDGLNAIPGIRCAKPQGAFYVFPDISGTGMTGAELAEGLLVDAGVCVLAGTAFGGVGVDHIRISYANSRENLHGGPEPDSRLRRHCARQRRRDEAEGLRLADHPGRRSPADRRGVRCGGLAGRAAATARGPPPLDRGLRRRPDAPHRPGRRRVPRRGRPAAQGRQQLRGRVRQHRRRGVHEAGHPGRQHARRPHGDDRRPRLGAAHGRGPAAPGGRPLRPRREVEDLGPDAPDGSGRPRRHPGDHRVRADRAGGRAAGARLRDADPVSRPASRQPGGRGGVRRRVPDARGHPPGVGLRHAPREPQPRDEGPDQRGAPRAG